MGSHGEDSVRIAEALCLEVRPLQKTTFGIKFGHRKAFSLDSTCTLHEALYTEPETPGPSSVHTQGRDLRAGHLLRSRISRQASISQWHRESPSAQLSFSGFSIRSRTSLQPLRSNLSRNPHMSSEDPEGGSSHNQRASLMSLTSSVEEHEVGEQTLRAAADLSMASTLLTPTLTVEDRISRRERKRLKSLRRRQKRRERGRQNDQRSTGNLSSSSEEDEQPGRDREGFICAVCLDVYFSPYMCHPCSHIFCEPCLRTLAKNCPSNTPCPLCRTTITHVFFQKELNQTARTFFPKEYMARKQNFQKACCAKWPLPSCRKLFRIFGGFQRQASPIARRQFPHGGYRLDAFNFEDDSHGWRFDMDMVIIYIYSVNWVIGIFIFCFFCYFFFLSL